MSSSNTILPFYTFPCLAWWRVLHNNENALIEVHEHWVKQSFRSRYEIAGPNGKQSLSIPTIKKSRLQFKDVRISYAEDWVTNHKRSLKTAYNSSPYYAYYVHEYEAILDSKPKYLLDFNMQSLAFGSRRLEVEVEHHYTKDFHASTEVSNLENGPTPYNQVFEEKHGFLPGLSFLDALFNCGPASGALLI